MNNAEFWAKIKLMREWAETPLGKLFSRFESLTGSAWQIDSTSNSDRRMKEAWDKQAAARTEFLRALGAPIDGVATADPLPSPLLPDDPFTEGQKRQLDEALHFQNALVDLLGEPNEKLEPWALAKIKAMQEALAAAEARIAELEAENETLGSVNNDMADFIGRGSM